MPAILKLNAGLIVIVRVPPPSTMLVTVEPVDTLLPPPAGTASTAAPNCISS